MFEQILILEDDIQIGDIFVQLIHLLLPDMTTVVARDHGKFSSWIEQQEFRVILMDVGVLLSARRESVDSILSEVRKRQKSACIILMSGRTQDECMDLVGGVYPFLQKPFTFRELTAVLQTVLPNCAVKQPPKSQAVEKRTTNG